MNKLRHRSRMKVTQIIAEWMLEQGPSDGRPGRPLTENIKYINFLRWMPPGGGYVVKLLLYLTRWLPKQGWSNYFTGACPHRKEWEYLLLMLAENKGAELKDSWPGKKQGRRAFDFYLLPWEQWFFSLLDHTLYRTLKDWKGQERNYILDLLMEKILTTKSWCTLSITFPLIFIWSIPTESTNNWEKNITHNTQTARINETSRTPLTGSVFGD